VREWLEREAGWQADADAYDVNFRVQVFRDVGFVGFQLTGPRKQRHDYRAVTRPGSLAPSLAYCMARLTEPVAGDVFMDPMCGAGTLVVERALGWGFSALLCGDIAEDAVQATEVNLRAAGVAATVRQWDATDLPVEDASVDKVATNMPYGKDVAIRSPGTMVPAFVRQMSHVIRPCGRLVVLTAHGKKLLRELKRSKAFRAPETTRLEHLGFRLSLVSTERR
jgi:tRNA (guanine6-N2)-methyltransferase